MNSFSFILFWKHFICPSILSNSFAGQSNLGCKSLLFITLNACCQSLLDCKVSFQISADSLMGTVLWVTLSFSLVAFKILSLSLTFGISIMICSWCGPLWVQLFGVSLCFLDLYVYFLHQIRKVFFHYFFRQSSNFLLFLFSFCHPPP